MCHTVFLSLSVAYKISLFISSVVSFLLAHSHCFSNTFTLTNYAVQCHAFLPLQSLANNLLSNSSAIRFFSAHSNNITDTCRPWQFIYINSNHPIILFQKYNLQYKSL
jgi:hypothetical protein